MAKLLSVLVPMYNEAEVISIFVDTLRPILDGLPVDWEIICVNDGSTDNTLKIVREMSAIDDRIKVLNLSRNFGKESALTAALDHARGDAVIPIDADLQDPPQIIPQMVDLWLAGVDVVNAVRSNRDTDTRIKRLTARYFYVLMNAISNIDVPQNVGDFRLISRRVLDVLNSMRERRRFMKGLFSWVGFSSANVFYERQGRAAGKTKWNYWRLWNFAIEGITSFSTFPLKIATYCGFMLAFISLTYAINLTANTLIVGTDVKGYPSIMTAVLFFGGVNLMFIGIVGEYVGRIYEEVKQRPIYILESSTGFDKNSN
ncbi:glycosyltransferase family 2 protein [Rhizobium sp. CFBP 8762]|uniref:glycosyltransferase family 2 protein n=1 Tax=Rhizobium sp. CFBP 8762 TaxID=2775279 RepID=UPI00177DC73A|nr:glycosyltransferase family 2 protein [Rhizobium sp. CFBP 8762]MBD8554663.1 glycosyltransferase family 2 protein [Rhizobium sp. CFBP 8762]